MNRNKKILNVTMAAGMAAVLGTTPVIAAAQEADNGVSKEETVYVNATACLLYTSSNLCPFIW